MEGQPFCLVRDRGTGDKPYLGRVFSVSCHRFDISFSGGVEQGADKPIVGIILGGVPNWFAIGQGCGC